MKRNRKSKISHIVLGVSAFFFSLYKNHKLKVKLMSWSSRMKKEDIFILSEGFFFNLKTTGGSQFDSPPVVFLKMYLLKRG